MGEQMSKKTIVRDGNGRQKLKEIRVAYAPGTTLALESLHDLQGDLKELSEESYAKLSSEITSTGFAFAPHVWRNPRDKKYYLLDGHQRIKTVRRLIKESAYRIDHIPVVVVDAKTEKEAKRRILQATSQYGRVTPEGLSEFIRSASLSLEELIVFDIPTIDVAKMIATYDNGGEDARGKRGEDGSEIEAGEFTKLVHECPKCGHKFSRD